MEKIVLDASVIVKWYSEEEGSDLSRQILLFLKNKKIEIFLPELAKYELGNALLKGKKLPFSLAKKALESFYLLPLNFLKETASLAEKSYLLGEKLGITYYDACYLAVAKSLKAVLVTENPRHQVKRKLGIKIFTLQEYVKILEND
jgi:predicted nucleic acid-binding protein